LLDPKDFGLLAMATVFSGLADQTQFFGVGPALIQRDTVTPENQRAAFTISLLSSSLLYLVLFLCAVPIGWFYKDDRVVPILRVIALTFPIGALAVVPRATLRRNLTLRGEALTNLAVMLSDAAVTILMAWSGFGVWALVAGKVVGAAMTAVGLSMASPWRPAIGLKDGDARSLLSFGTVITMSSYMWYAYRSADLLIIGRALGEVASGIYSMALNLARMPMERLWVALTPLLFPLFSRARSEPGELGRVLCRMTRYNALILFPLIAGLGAVADDAVSVVLGDKWQAATAPLRFLCLYLVTRSVLALLPPVLQALGLLRPLLLFHTACLIVLPAGFLLALPWGPVGVAVSLAITYPFVGFAMLLPVTLRAVQLGVGRYFGSLARPAVATSLMVAAVVLGGLLPVEGVVRLIVRMAIGGVVYVACIRVLEGPIIAEARALLRDAKKGVRA
jgi:O-antigen/teichoic acid export membrane protein